MTMKKCPKCGADILDVVDLDNNEVVAIDADPKGVVRLIQGHDSKKRKRAVRQSYYIPHKFTCIGR